MQAGAGFPVMKEEAVNKVGRTGGGQKHRENVSNQTKNAQSFSKRHISFDFKTFVLSHFFLPPALS